MSDEKRDEPMKYSRPELVCAIDIESSSGHNRRPPCGREADATTGDIIGIGVAFMRFDYDKGSVECLESALFGLYRPDDGYRPDDPAKLHAWDRTIFSDDCWNNFWNKDEGAILALPKLKDPMIEKIGRKAAERRAIISLLEHMRNWSSFAKENGYKFRLVSDCSSFDFGNIDAMILEHLPDFKGTLHVGGWNGAVRCCTTKDETILGLVDNYWARREKPKGESWDITERLHKLYGVPESPFKHTHMPDADAKNIGWRYLTGKAIEDGVYTLDTSLVETPPKRATRPFYAAHNKKPRV